MTYTSQFGNFITRSDVEQGVMTHIQKWFTVWIAEVERQSGIEAQSIELPKAWDVVTQFTRFPDDRLPWIAVVSQGIHGGRPPRRDGDGEMSASWLVSIGAIVSASDPIAAKDLAGYYGAAIRGLMLQKPSLGGWASSIDWDDESYTDVGRLLEKNLAGVRLAFTVEVRGVLNVFAGYPGDTPPDDPYSGTYQNTTVKEGGVSIEIDKVKT